MLFRSQGQQTWNSVFAPPTAVNDSYSVNEDNTLTVGAPGVLSNDSDPDLDPLTAILVSAPSNGGLSFNADGSFVYTPNANFFGTDTFTYKANDGNILFGDSNIATVTITVNGTLTVNSTSDVADGDTSSIAALRASVGADGVISLREAILAANNTGGINTISFEIPDALVGGLHTIDVLSPLPTITDRKSTRLNSSHIQKSRMPSSA